MKKIKLFKMKKIEVGDKLVIPKGVEFFSISLQESVIFTRDLVIKVTNIYSSEIDPDLIFGTIQMVFNRMELGTSYLDKVNGEIDIRSEKLEELDPHKLYY